MLDSKPYPLLRDAQATGLLDRLGHQAEQRGVLPIASLHRRGLPVTLLQTVSHGSAA